MSVHLKPEEIEAESFRIIDHEAGVHSWPSSEWEIIRRAIHTSADFEYVRSMVFGNHAVTAGIAALRGGRSLFTDTTMALAGISKPGMFRFNIEGYSFVGDAEVARQAREEGVTRSIVAMRRAVAICPEGVFVIGNAPTALFELLRLVKLGEAVPALVVGLPVGFVGAAESKEALEKLAQEVPAIPFITNRGRKGGSNVAAAVLNALLILAARESR